jgi:hypothetical protein
LKAGLAYSAIVFWIGFVLGAFRVLILVPFLGTIAAAVVELPFMLAVSWIACQWVIERFSVSNRAIHRFAMGGLAFGLLMALEVGVSVFGFGQTVAEHFGTYREASAVIGLTAQILFALMPVIRIWA